MIDLLHSVYDTVISSVYDPSVFIANHHINSCCCIHKNTASVLVFAALPKTPPSAEEEVTYQGSDVPVPS